MAKKEEALTTRNPLALARPSFIKEGDLRGTESIGVNDIKPPALKLAQGTSDEIKRAVPAKYIEGLREGEFFNSTTKEIYGEGPLSVVVVNPLGHRNVEFDAVDKTIVLDFDVPDGDPRTQFTEEVKDGKRIRVKPRATLFYDYLVLVTLEDGRRNMMTMSLKSTQLKKAKDLNTIFANAKMPTFALQFNVTAVPERKRDHNYYGWLIQPSGYVSEELYNEASSLYEQFKGKTVVVERDAAEETIEPAANDIPF